MVASTSKLIGMGEPAGLAKLIGNTVQTLAGVGTAQSGAKAVTVNNALLTTSGGATAFVLSTDWAIGDEVTVFNTSATAALVYPPSGGAFDGGSTDASVSLAQNVGRTFIKTTSTAWRSTTGAASSTTLAVSGAATIGGTLGVTGATTMSTATVQSGVAVPASSGAVAAGAPLTMYASGPSIYVTSDAPAFSAIKGSLCINTGGSSASTRLYVNNGTTTWIAVTTTG
jgi:fibronectin-binding autotransporter adhesin